MTPYTVPVDPATDVASAQLDLFPSPLPPAPQERRGLTRALALASVSPGLWWQVTALFAAYGDDVTVHTCEERDGQLVIEATLVDDDGSFEQVLERIRETAARTCGCCGGASARPYLVALDGPRHNVCDTCRSRLKEGASPLQIADDFFCLDGSRRFRSFGYKTPHVATPAVALRSCTALPADELRRIITEIRDSMSADVRGQDEACGRLATLAALHVGGGLPRGARALVLGSSGHGKTTMIRALQRALQPWDLPWVVTDALDLTSPGWSGAPSIGDLVEVAVNGKPDSERARHAIIVLDEIHHVGVLQETTGNFSAKRAEILASLLGIADYGTVHFESGATWSSERALVIAMGAFTGLLDLTKPVNIRDLVKTIPLELCTRFTEEIITLKRLSEPDLIELLRRWPTLTGLQVVCERLGFSVTILDESYRRAARVVTIGNDASTPRTAGGWLVSALRQELMRALSDPEVRDIVIAPDSLPIPPTAMRRPPPDEPPGGPDDWDTTVILTRR